MNSIIIDNKEFKSKAKLTQFTREKIKEIGIGEIIKENENFNFFLDLLKRHPDYENKIGPGLQSFVISINKLNKKVLEISLKTIDNKIVDFSYIKCCNNNIKRCKLTQAMRNAVSDYTIKYKTNNNLICSLCKVENLNYTDYHVDHYELSFDEIKKSFLSQKDLIIPSTFKKSEKYNTYSFLEEDKEFELLWINTHNKKCKLRILCNKCNTKK